MKESWRLIQKLVTLLLFLVGLLVMCYPFYVDALNTLYDQYMLAQLEKKADDQQLKKYQKNNQKIVSSGLSPGNMPFNQTAVDSEALVLQYHLIGSINFPQLNQEIPLYDETNFTLMNHGATVVQGTSYPIGGKNTHALISGHRGLPQREIFTDLPKLKIGDTFVLTVLGKKLAYEVDQITTVLPDDTSKLSIEAEKDLVTLLTCTPYMINTHRLLVRGQRIPYNEKIAAAARLTQKKQRRIKILIVLAVATAVLLILVGMVQAWRVYLLRRRKIHLHFNYPAAAQKTYQLYDKKGRQAIKRNGQPLEVQADAAGSFGFENLPGNLYRIKEKNQSAYLLTGLKSVRQKKIQIFNRPNVNYHHQQQQIMIDMW